MTTNIDICNMALSELGTQSQITALNDGSVEANACTLWYDTMRRRLLRTASWGFARRQVALTQLGDLIPDNTSTYPYLFKYKYPTDALKIRYLLPPNPLTGTPTPPGATPYILLQPSRQWRFLIASETEAAGVKNILSNLQSATGVYTADVSDTLIFDELFIGALASALAFKLVMPLSGNIGMRQTFQASAQQAIMEARAADGNEAVPMADVQVDWMQARGAGTPFGYGPSSVGWGQWYNGDENMNWGA